MKCLKMQREKTNQHYAQTEISKEPGTGRKRDNHLKKKHETQVALMFFFTFSLERKVTETRKCVTKRIPRGRGMIVITSGVMRRMRIIITRDRSTV